MRFLFLNSAHDWGGNEKWTYLAAKSLSNDNEVYLAYRDDIFGDHFDFDIQKLKLPFIFEFDLFTILKMIFLIKKKQIDVLIPTKRKEYVIAGIAAKICGIKNILRLGIVRDLQNKWYNNFVYNKLADGIIVNAKCIKDVLLKSKFLQADKIRVIYNGLDIDNLTQNLLNDDQQDNTSFVISSMGRIIKRKGFDYLIRGFSHFLNLTEARDAELVIIGEGDYLPTLKELLESLHISDKVSLSGFLKDPYPYIAMSNVFVLLSENEGIPNALLEAMFFKNAVITTAAGGISEIVENEKNGYLMEKIDIIHLGELIRELYQNPEERKKIGEEARKTVLEKFSLKKMKNEIEDYCKEIIGF
jgi:glycosyltransferase involved in cell wall biosynthesis